MSFLHELFPTILFLGKLSHEHPALCVLAQMEPLIPQMRPGAGETIECWDDDDDLQFNDDIHFRAASSTGSSFRPSAHRDSISSRHSARSDLESNAGDEDWQVPLDDNDENAKEAAIASAKNAGIPIPTDIPNSALLGGTIKRLSSRKPKRTFVDDWSEDVELPGPDMLLELKTPQATVFPESLRQVSSTASSPVKSTAPPSWNEDISTRLQSLVATLHKFQDENEEPGKQDVPTIKAPTPRSPHKSPAAATRSLEAEQEVDDFDRDLELPPDHQPLQLSQRRDRAGVSSPTLEDFDAEWSEGSIGVRVGGTARDGRSIPSSSISVASPSVSSCLTAESEDDGLDGLVIPDGPLDFTSSLKRRQEAQIANDSIEAGGGRSDCLSSEIDDFFFGIETDDGKAFNSRKLTLNPNVKCKTEWPASPTRRSATTVTFTSGTGSPRTRISRLSGHERTHSTHLETVSESGAPLSKFRRPHSRLGHSSQSSVSSLPASGALSISPTPAVSNRRLLGSRASKNATLAGESKVPSRQLRTKRSMPTIRGLQLHGSTHLSQEPLSRPDTSDHPLPGRPKTPDPATTEGKLLGRRTQVPFVPAGASEVQSHHVSVKSYRSSRRTNSDSSGGLLSPPGTISRLSRSTRSGPFGSSLGESSGGPVSSTGKRTVTRPSRRRNFGDGTELAAFDDLPTSASTESKFVKAPIGRGAPRSVRSKLSQSRDLPPRGESPPPSSSPAPSSWPLNSLPRFARDTNASRNAREQRIASMSMNPKVREAHPLTVFSSNWKSPPISRIPPSSAPVRSRKANPAAKSAPKPHLIKPLGSGVQEAKCK